MSFMLLSKSGSKFDTRIKRSFSFTQNIYSNIKEKGGQAASICVQFSGNVK